MVVDRRVGTRHGGGEPTVERRVQELSRLSKENLAEVVQRKTGLLHGIGHSHSLEVASVMHCAVLSIDQWVIGG